MTDKLRVMLVVNKLAVGGAERQVVELARGLDKSSFDVHVVTLHAGGALDDELAGEPGVRLNTLQRASKLDLGAVRRLAAMLREERTQILQPFLTPATFFAFSAGLLARTPVLVLTERSGARIARRRLGNRAFRLAERTLGRFATAAVPNSEAGRELLLARGIDPSKVRVIHNGVNPARLRPSRSTEDVRRELGVSADAPLAGIVGRLDEAKDHGTLLRALAIARESLPGLALLIVGDGRLRAQLERLCVELNLAESVRLLGNQEDVASLIGALDLAVLSSNDSEGSSNFLLEAMGQGKPVVATDVGGNRELIANGRCGVLVPPGDPTVFAAAMVDVLGRPDRGHAMGLAGLEDFRQRFTLERMICDYEGLYWQMATEKGLMEGQARYAAAA